MVSVPKWEGHRWDLELRVTEAGCLVFLVKGVPSYVDPCRAIQFCGDQVPGARRRTGRRSPVDRLAGGASLAPCAGSAAFHYSDFRYLDFLLRCRLRRHTPGSPP